jgi:hypothetical protein
MNYCWINDLLLAGVRQVFKSPIDSSDFSSIIRAEEQRAVADAR